MSNESETETQPDGGVSSLDYHQRHQVDYLQSEVNILRPKTPYMREHLRVIWIGFILWALAVFGPVTATAMYPSLMTSELPIISFPAHYFAIAIGAPSMALILSAWYAHRRDRLDEKYNSDTPSNDDTVGEEES